ncbi:MAG: DUF2207 domain-containing protein [Patescibacteria group bacterium]|jgi:uncharacterized membrane protein YgcG
MRKVILIVAVLFGGLVFFPQLSHAQTSTFEQIKAFDVQIEAAKEGTFIVTEKIVYDFGATAHHGIFRDIPYRYRRDVQTYSIRLDLQSVTNDQGKAWPYTERRSGGELHVKIGDKDSTVTGMQTYVLTYTLRRAVNTFNDSQEIYWNATGNHWQVPMQAASATVSLPDGTKPDELVCYTGVEGATLQNCSKQVQADGKVVFVAQSLAPAEGLTFAIKVPSGTFDKATTAQRWQDFVVDNWTVLLIPIGWFLMHQHWRKRGKDPKGRGTIIPEYEAPEKLRPAMLGTVWDGSGDMRDISATIIDLAVRGHLKIKDLGKKNYEFTRLVNPKDTLNAFEQKLFDELFLKTASKKTVELKDLKQKFYTAIPELKKQLHEALVTDGYYTKNPANAKATYLTLAGFLIIGPWVLFASTGVFPLITVISLSAVGFIVLAYGFFMPQRTVKGAEVRERIEGFKWFLSVTEKERLKFHNAPERKPEQFQALLPYAMVLEVEKQWAQQFASLEMQPPSWYTASPGNVFNALFLASVMSDFRSSANSAMVSRPASAGGGGSGFGGGGFSGGGFGGGGGGSW